MINPEDITIYDSSVGFTNGKEFKLEITRLNVNELIDIRNDILINQTLREKIIDLADLWDGQESSRYGDALQFILDELGITEMPKFYSNENIKEIVDELIRERKNDKKES